jgi:hypothetical protein
MTARIGQLEHDNRDKTTVADSHDSTFRTERLGHDSNDRRAMDKVAGQVSWNRIAGTG